MTLKDVLLSTHVWKKHCTQARIPLCLKNKESHGKIEKILFLLEGSLLVDGEKCRTAFQKHITHQAHNLNIVGSNLTAAHKKKCCSVASEQCRVPCKNQKKIIDYVSLLSMRAIYNHLPDSYAYREFLCVIYELFIIHVLIYWFISVSLLSWDTAWRLACSDSVICIHCIVFRPRSS